MELLAPAKLSSSEVEKINFNLTNDLLGKTPHGLAMIDNNQFMASVRSKPEQDELWCDNYRRNRRHCSAPYPELKGKNQETIILVGSSPAIKKNVDLLKNLNGFTIIACNAVLKYLLELDIKPDFTMLVEGGHHVAKDFDCDTKGMDLIFAPSASSEAIDKWQGTKWLYLTYTSGEYRKLIEEDYPDEYLNICGGNVTSAAMMWAYRYLKARHFISIGMSLCYYGDYYHDRRVTKSDEEKKLNPNLYAIDMYGEIVRTTASLLVYKVWMENFLKYQLAYGGSFTNSTEDGIFGVLPEPVEVSGTQFTFRPKFVPWINIVPLKMSIEANTLRMEDAKNGTGK